LLFRIIKKARIIFFITSLWRRKKNVQISCKWRRRFICRCSRLKCNLMHIIDFSMK